MDVYETADEEAFKCLAKLIGHRGDVQDVFDKSAQIPEWSTDNRRFLYGKLTSGLYVSAIHQYMEGFDKYVHITNERFVDEEDRYQYGSAIEDTTQETEKPTADETTATGTTSPSTTATPSTGSSGTAGTYGGTQGATQAFDNSADHVTGTWRRADGKSVTISATTSGTMMLDLTGMGEDNPLPSGASQVEMGYFYQSPPPASVLDNQLEMVTHWAIQTASGTFEGTYATPGAGSYTFTEPPIRFTRVSPANTETIANLDTANPPQARDYLYIHPIDAREAYTVSHDTVLYRDAQ